MEYIRWENHSADLCVSLSKLYRNVELFDCILKTEGGFVKCHKAILAACSPYFKEMFVGHEGTNTVTLKEIKYNDMKNILDFIYYGEVDVQVIDVASFLKTAELLQITSLKRFASPSFSEKYSSDSAHERSSSDRVNFMNSSVGDLPLEGILEKEDQLSALSRLNCCTGTKAVDVARRAVNDVESDNCVVNKDNTIEEVGVEEVKVNVEDQMNSFTFVSIPPVLERSEGDLSCVDTNVKNPLEVCSHDCDKSKERDVKTEMGIKVEIKTEVEDVNSEAAENVSVGKTVENNSTSDNIPSDYETKHSCTCLARTTCGNLLISKGQMSGVQTNQNLILDNTLSTAISECSTVKRAEIYDVANFSGFEVKKEIPFLVDRGTQCSEEHDHTGEELSIIGYNQKGKDTLSDARRRSRTKLKEARIVVNRISVRTINPPPLVEIESDNADFKETHGPTFNRSDTSEKRKPMRNSSYDTDTFSCTECLAVFSSNIEYKEHLASHKLGEVVNFCQSRPSGILYANKRRRGRPQTFSTEEKPYLCNICGNSFLRKGHLSSHLRMHSGERPFQCKICETSFKFNYNLNRHLLTHNTDKPHVCGICNKTFKHESYLKQHMSTHSGERPFVCYICEQSFKMRSYLMTHLRIHSGERPFQCSVCEKSFCLKASLLVHTRSHTGEKPYECGVCKASFTIKGNLRQHMRIHTGDKPFSCVVCEMSFSHSSHRKRHMKTHAGVKPFACDVCERSFGERRSLEDHALLHSGDRPFRCGACGAAFTMRRYLQRHMSTHAQREPHVCGVCEKPYSTKSSLRTHMRTHSAEKPFACGVCQASFRSKGVLKIHTRVHTGVRPYKCDVCDVSYGHRSALTNHMRAHTGERPYVCGTCGRSYREKFTLTCHLRTHTGEKPFRCGVCGKSFRVESSQKRHMKVHTNKKRPSHSRSNSLR